MGIIKAVSSRAGIRQAIRYVTKTEKTEMRLMTGIHCSPFTATEEMLLTKEMWKKTGGRTYKHFIQSFAPDEVIDPETAHEIAVAYAGECSLFDGFEVLIATHKDREHVHTHFIVNSVSVEDGHKFQMSATDLKKMRELNDRFCRKYGLSICEKGKTFHGEALEETTAWTKEKYQFLQKAEKGKVRSFVQETAMAVMDCLEEAVSKEDFIDRLSCLGYRVDWQENHKYVTFIDPEGNRVRNRNLMNTFHLDLGKEDMLNVFQDNARRAEIRREEIRRAAEEQLRRTEDFTVPGYAREDRRSACKNTDRQDFGSEQSRAAAPKADREQQEFAEREGALIIAPLDIVSDELGFDDYEFRYHDGAWILEVKDRRTRDRKLPDHPRKEQLEREMPVAANLAPGTGTHGRSREKGMRDPVL